MKERCTREKYGTLRRGARRTKRKTEAANLVNKHQGFIMVERGRYFIMVAIPCLASTVLLVKVTRLDGISAIAIPYGPPVKTFKVLNLSNQQRSGLQEETKVCGLLYGLVFQSIVQFDTLPPHYILLIWVKAHPVYPNAYMSCQML